jgi:hypothetical protein
VFPTFRSHSGQTLRSSSVKFPQSSTVELL